jgi:hypothetical protein
VGENDDVQFAVHFSEVTTSLFHDGAYVGQLYMALCSFDKIVFFVLSLCRIIEKVMKSDRDVRETTGRIYLLIVPTASG